MAGPANCALGPKTSRQPLGTMAACLAKPAPHLPLQLP